MEPEKYQEIADKMAQSKGYLCASHIGKIADGTQVFYPFHGVMSGKPKRIRSYILINEKDAIWVRGVFATKIKHQLELRDLRRGKELFLYYLEVAQDSMHSRYTEEDYQYACEIRGAVLGFGYDGGNINEYDMYEYLEIAERLNMAIELFPDPSTTDRMDGWHYLLKLVKK